MKDQTLLFGIEKKGYSKIEVQAFVDKTSAQIAELEQENVKLRLKIDELSEINALLESRKSMIEQTLFNAELSARDIVEDAHNKARAVKESKEAELKTVDEKIQTKKSELEGAVKRIEYLLQSQLSLIEKYNKPD